MVTQDFVPLRHCMCQEAEQMYYNKINHCFFMEDNLCVAFIHGTENGKVVYNNFELSLFELSKVIRQYFSVSPVQKITIMVYCCFGGLQTNYSDQYTEIVSMCQTNEEVYYYPTYNKELNSKGFNFVYRPVERHLSFNDFLAVC